MIVEDEQLSLAIGRRGQNVRLASELIGSRIDIKSESDVKDEVADALAKMLQTAMSEGGEGEAAATPTPVDLTEAPGIGEKTAAALAEAGFDTLDALLEASEEDLEAVEGLGPKTAANLRAWATEKAEELAAARRRGRGRRGGDLRGGLRRGRRGAVDHGRPGLHGRPLQGVPGERGAARRGRGAKRPAQATRRRPPGPRDRGVTATPDR